MAYADNHSNNRRLRAGAAVVALEAGLAWAIITGLAITINRTPPTRTTTFIIPPDAPTIPPPPHPQSSAQAELQYQTPRTFSDTRSRAAKQRPQEPSATKRGSRAIRS